MREGGVGLGERREPLTARLPHKCAPCDREQDGHFRLTMIKREALWVPGPLALIAGGAEVMFNIMKGDLANATSDFDAATPEWRALLFSASTEGTTNNPDRQFIADVVGANGGTELSGTGYARKDVTSRSVTTNTTNDRAELHGTISAWTAINAGTAVALAIYRRASAGSDTAATDRLAFWFTTGFPKTTNGGDLTVTEPTAGLATLT